MQVSPLEEYALRCAVQLAKLPAEQHLSASKISELEGISVEYVSKIMFLFRQMGLVVALRGTQGGFRLGHPAQQITLRQIFDALKAKKVDETEFCTHYPGQAAACVHLSGCSIRPVWLVLLSYFDEFLTAITLGDLLASEEKIRQKVFVLISKKAKALKRVMNEET